MPRSEFHHHGEDRWDGEGVVSGLRFFHGAEFDLEPAADPPARDERLRRLVDALPAPERHMVERVHFAGVTLTTASDELGVSRSTGARIMRDAFERLRGWLDGEEEPPDAEDGDAQAGPDASAERASASCLFEHPDWGRCQQNERVHGLCAAHLFWLRTGITPDPGYHRRVIEGGRSVHEFLTETEMQTLTHGRYRGDGRRLDQYVIYQRDDEPGNDVGWEPPFWPGGEV